MTANELNADSARALAAEANSFIASVREARKTCTAEYGVHALVSVVIMQQDLITHALARIEALEAAARERVGDGK